MTTAIETRYAGCHFRSRIEARWAVLFDHLEIGWEYEPQGFILPSGPYLPDFRLDLGDGVWWEVKGKPPTLEERAALFDLVLETGIVGYVAWGGIPRDFTEESRISDAMGNRVRWFVSSRSVGWTPEDFDHAGVDHPRLFEAYTAARSARFDSAAA
ncbi:holiday junction resolvase [Mycobacterium phage Ritam007]|nr:hypothetical protein Saroj_72 [Mycobacterium phage Saroj]UZV39598.1 holiday junction resolvase [Mycobacterium phage Ritam007]